MKVIVTGASGHIGGNLVRALAAQGYDDIRALIRTDRRALAGLDVEVVEVDVLNSTALTEAFDGARAVFHLAGMVSVDPRDSEQLNRVNVDGTRNVIAACQSVGVERLVHFSTVHALADHLGESEVDEHCPLAEGPDALPYDRSKAAAERLVLDSDVESVIVNPSGVIGPFDFKPSQMGEALLGMYHRDLPSLVNGGFNWVDVRDVTTAAVAALKHGQAGERYLLTGHWRSLPDLSRTIASIRQVKTTQWSVPMWVARGFAPVMTGVARMFGKRPLYTSQSLAMLDGFRHVSHAKATRDLGYSPRPLEETIRDTFNWFESEGMLDG